MPRSTKADMAVRYDAIMDFAKAQQPVTVRQVSYNLAAKSLVPKNNNGYQQVARACQLRSVGASAHAIRGFAMWHTQQKTPAGERGSLSTIGLGVIAFLRLGRLRYCSERGIMMKKGVLHTIKTGAARREVSDLWPTVLLYGAIYLF